METELTKLKRGATGIIKRMVGGYGFQIRLSSMGIRVGKQIKLVSSQPFRGPLVIEIDNIRVAIGRGMANKILVEQR